MIRQSIGTVALLLFMVTAVIAGDLNKEQTRNRKMVRHYAKVMKVDTDFCDAIARVESDYLSGAYNDNTPKTRKVRNAEDWISRGVMQTTLATGRTFNKEIIGSNDLYVPEKNIVAGVKYIRYLFKNYPDATFVEIAQLYNLGETRYNKGSRNQEYVNRFLRAFNSLKK